MVATPGIIEGGKNEKLLNFKLGEMISFCDFVIIIGEHNKQAILNGLKNKHSKAQIFTCKTIEIAKQHFKLLNTNDNLLLLNDLPDDYS